MREIEVDVEATLIWSKTFKVFVEDGETDDEAIARAVSDAKDESVGEGQNWDFNDDSYDVLEARDENGVL